MKLLLKRFDSKGVIWAGTSYLVPAFYHLSGLPKLVFGIENKHRRMMRMNVKLIAENKNSSFGVLEKYGLRLYSNTDMIEWGFRVMDAYNGVIIIPPSNRSIKNAWFINDDCCKTHALCVFKYNARAKGDAEGDGVVRKFFAPYIGIILVSVESSFVLTLPTHHSHNIVKYNCRVTADSKFVNEDYPPYHRLLKISDDLPVFSRNSDELPVNLFGIGKGMGYRVKQYNEGTFVRVDSRLSSQWLAEVFIKKEDYGKVAVGIYSPSWEFDDFYASVKESKKPIVYEYCDRHGSRLLLVTPRDNEFVISGGKSKRYFVDEDGKISEVK